MLFTAILLAALSAGAHTLPASDATIGGDLSSELNTAPHDPAIADFSDPNCIGKEAQPPLSFNAAGCYPFDSAFDTVGINWGSDDNCGLNVYTDPNCGNFATHSLTGLPYGFTCFNMSANGGPWRSLAPVDCYANDEQ